MILEKLEEISTKSNAQFSKKLIPDAKNILGCKIPDVRKIARELKGSPEAQSFLDSLPHTYYEENILHICFLSYIKSPQELQERIEAILPYIDNWAVCDCLATSCKLVRKNKEFFFPLLEKWYAQGQTYYVRCAIDFMLAYFIEDQYIEKIMKYACIQTEDYYINMSVAWLIQAVMVKYYDLGVTYLKEHRFSYFVHNKAIRKCVDSRMFSLEQKERLKSLSRKK